MAESNNLNSLRTTEEVINALSTLYFNLNEIERIYYDLFISTEAKDVTLQRYDDKGKLETIIVPNRAKDSQSILTGSGSPEGIKPASMGSHYIDLSSGALYYKYTGSDAYGWTLIYAANNFIAGTNYVTPTGDASQLVNLNMTNAGSGVLAVGRGGTGSTGINGLIKGNGDSAYTAAEDGNDYMGPNSMTGIICYYPLATIPQGWLLCDGAEYSKTTYARLYNALKIVKYTEEGEEIIELPYGEGSTSDMFRVPNLMQRPVTAEEARDGVTPPSYYIRCWDGVSEFNVAQYDQVGKHTHDLTGQTDTEAAHTHEPGTLKLTGSVDSAQFYGSSTHNGVFAKSSFGGKIGAIGGNTLGTARIEFDSTGVWVGKTGSGSAHSHLLTGKTAENESEFKETRVLSKMLVPVIKY